MEAAQHAHDLFLLMLNLSQVRQRQRVQALFLDAMNHLLAGTRLRWLGEDEPSTGEVLPVATPRHAFGRLVFEVPLEAPSETPSDALLALVRNAVGMLALILENRLQAELLADENARLEIAVEERTVALREEIAERQRLLNQIQEQARQVQQIIDTVPEGVILLDPEGRVMRVNPMGARDLTVLAGIAVGERLTHLGGRPLERVLDPPPRGLWHEIADDRRAFQVIARTLDGDALSEGWVLVIRDVTQQREVQQRIEQQERLAAVGQLAAGIAHDFNNVMAAIVLYAQIVANSPHLTMPDRARLHVINEQAQHAADLIDQILDFSRSAVMARHVIDCVPLFKEQVKLLQRILPEHIEVKLRHAETAGTFIIHADPTRLRQMLMNLALNARDAMPSGGVLSIELDRLTVTHSGAGPLPGMVPGPWVRITVSDTGTGIPPDILPHIYEPFVTTKGPGEGSGLGLAQVHGIVKLHDGEIDVETQAGVGTSFTIYLPQTVEPASPALPTEDAHTFAPGAGQRILVAEDNAATRSALVDSLEMLNYQVSAVPDGAQAWDFISTSAPIDLIISDVVMPQMGGMALLRALRQSGNMTPVLLLTGHPMGEALEQVAAADAVQWMLKPPNLIALADLVAEMLHPKTEI